MAELKKSDWPLVALILMAGITTAAHIGKAPPALPLLRAELGLTLVEAGWVTSIIAALAMAVGMLSGVVADRVGHRRMLIIGLAVLSLSGFVGSQVDISQLLLLSRFFEGLGFIAVAVSAPSLIILSILPRHRQIVLGVWSAWIPAGISVSMFVSPLVLAPYGWRGLWLVWAGIAIVLALALIIKRQPTPSPQQKIEDPKHSFFKSAKLVISRPGPIVLALAFMVFAMQWGSMMMWIPSFLVEQRAMSVSLSALLGALVVAVNVPGNLIGGWLLHRGVERWQLMAVTHFIMGACAVGIFSDVLPDVLRYGLALLFSHSAGYLPAAVFASVPVHAPSHRQFGATSGLLLQGSNTGNFFGPPAVAAIVAAFGGWSSAMWLMLAGASMGIVLSVFLGIIERRGS